MGCFGVYDTMRDKHLILHEYSTSNAQIHTTLATKSLYLPKGAPTTSMVFIHVQLQMPKSTPPNHSSNSANPPFTPQVPLQWDLGNIILASQHDPSVYLSCFKTAITHM